MRHCLFLFIILFSACICRGDFEEIFEGELEKPEEGWEILERLEFLKRNPLDLNIASEEDLREIPWLTGEIAKEIIKLRKERGGFKRLEELKLVEGMDGEIFERISKYIKIGEKERTYGEFMLKIQREFPESFGYFATDSSGNKFQSSTIGTYFSLKVFHGNKFSGLAVLEKDPGEGSIFDFVSGNIEINRNRERIILGNYKLDFGRGLLFGTGKVKSKFSNPEDRQTREMRGYSSVDENRSLLGIAYFKKIGEYTNAILFISNNWMDGLRDTSTGKALSFIYNGLHRNEKERRNKDFIKEEVVGGRISLGFQKIQIGMNMAYLQFEPEIFPPLASEERFYSFRGKKNMLSGFDFETGAKEIRIFGEGAMSSGGGNAEIVGMHYSKRGFIFSVFSWNYSRNYFSPHSGGYSITNQNNEYGIHWRWNWRAFDFFRFQFYFEEYKNPWRRYFEKMPKGGGEVAGETEIRFNSNTKFQIRRKLKWNEENHSINGESKIYETKRKSTRYQIEISPSNKFILRGRAEIVRYEIPSISGEKGSSLGFFIHYPENEKFQVIWGATYFDTDSYNSRIYEYEKDLPGIISNKVLFGKGRKLYILLKEDIGKNISFSLKYSNLWKYGVSSIGSGLDETEGNIREKAGFSLSMKF